MVSALIFTRRTGEVTMRAPNDAQADLDADEISPGRTHGFHRAIAGFTSSPFGRESFAVTCPRAATAGPRENCMFARC